MLTFIQRAAFIMSALVFLGGMPIDGRGELYLGGQLGMTVPQDFSDVEGSGAAFQPVKDSVPMHNAFLWGGKIGYFISHPRLKWLGVEVDAFRTSPQVASNTYLLTTPTGDTTSITEGFDLAVTTVAFRLMFRTPNRDPMARFQPYLGIGPTYFRARLRSGTGDSTDSGIGFSLALGLRVLVNERLGAFAEYKGNGASFQFDDALAPNAGIRSSFIAHHFILGISVHWHGL